MPADVVLDAHPEVHFPGEVRAIYPSADRDKATIPVRVRFLSEDPRIRPDLGAKVTFLKTRPTTEIVTVRRVIRIPSTAVQSKNGEKFVWLVRDGKVEPVTGHARRDERFAGRGRLRPQRGRSGRLEERRACARACACA